MWIQAGKPCAGCGCRARGAGDSSSTGCIWVGVPGREAVWRRSEEERMEGESWSVGKTQSRYGF